MSNKPNDTVSPITIISLLETEAKELICEIPIGLKQKVISIQQTLKILSKRINELTSLDQTAKPRKIHSPKESKEIRKTNDNFSIEQAHKDLQVLRMQNEALNSRIAGMSKNINNLQKKISEKTSINDNLNYLLNEERNNSKALILQVRTVEDSFKTLSDKYNSLVISHQELLTELATMSKLNSDMKKYTNNNKCKYSEVIEVNNELKNKLASYESVIKTHTHDLQILMRKNSQLNDKLQEANKRNDSLITELNYKEERLKAIRVMNSKLEQKSNCLLKKWDAITKIEEQSYKITMDAQEANKTLKEVSNRLEKEISSKRGIESDIKKLTLEKEALIQELNRVKEENNSLRKANISDKLKDIIANNNES